MLRGELHNVSADGVCEACGEPFPCPMPDQGHRRRRAHPRLWAGCNVGLRGATALDIPEHPTGAVASRVVVAAFQPNRSRFELARLVLWLDLLRRLSRLPGQEYAGSATG